MTIKHYTKLLILSLLFIFSLTSCQVAETDVEQQEEPQSAEISPEKTLTLGDVSGSAAWTIEHFQPLADYLAENLSEFGITHGKVIVTSDLPSMLDHLETGQVDLYFDSPFPALEVYEQIGAQPLARRWKGGVSEYYSLIVVHKDSGITDLEGLIGQVLAFDHPASTSGYLLPKAHLVINGYETTELDEVSGTVSPSAIGYAFAFGEENQALWLLDGKVAGAAFSNGDFNDMSEEQREQLVILAQTPSVPRHIALSRPGMGNEMREKITTLLLELHITVEGQKVLEAFEGTSRFDELPGGVEGIMNSLRELFAPVR
ncbi:MAG: phosphate/phosphite/phosphonate ABC transporter substrate-binding protein [Anaerolineales bacterium]|nr:phosphate/phosphite/phosphonate ABC transporter substrate-binding protein [Chloroflexota bacterium]MBL6979732.1 phosphate/phosphite/phosphonate ABC transporter substrate-binding protein [Anaerolineales bacterium]